MSQITLYTWPKSFNDPLISTIQRNAVRSWLKLVPKPEVLVFGDEPGTAEYCAEFGLRHLRVEVETIQGLPTLRDLTAKAEAASNTPFYCFVNADIILTSRVMTALAAVSERFPEFFLGGSPRNLDVPEALDFTDGWERTLMQRAIREGTERCLNCSDFFLFPRGYLNDAPPLIIGRNHVDNGLMYYTRKRGAALVDATTGAITIHQNHDYRHLGAGQVRPVSDGSGAWNERCMGGKGHLYTWSNATHHYTPDGLRPYPAGQLCRWSSFSLPGRLFGMLVFGPIAKITSPVRKALGLTNPRSLSDRRLSPEI